MAKLLRFLAMIIAVHNISIRFIQHISSTQLFYTMPSASIHCDIVHFRRIPFFKKKNVSSEKEGFPPYFICHSSLGSVAQSPSFLRGQCTNRGLCFWSSLMHFYPQSPASFGSRWLVPTAGSYSSLQHPFLHQDMSFRTALQRTGP